MSYNKLNALLHNIEAIEIVLGSDSTVNYSEESKLAKLRLYSGFGGIKEVMCWNHYTTAADVIADQDQVGPVIAAGLLRLYTAVNNYTDDELQTYRIMNSIAESVLNAFYTPEEVISATREALNHVLCVFGLSCTKFLEPSAGVGGFLSAAPEGSEKVAFEIDFLTAEILRAINPDAEVYNQGFQQIDKIRKQNADNGSAVLTPDAAFDIVASNIPFSQFGVHDAVFESGDDVHRRSLEKIHRYFFVKALEQLEDGGILAFVTSRGIADSLSCDYLRKWLVEKGNLLAAVRLPDNLFMQGSGVEVGSDLLVIQRDSHKGWQTTVERQFVESKDKCIVVNGNSAIVPAVNTLLSQRRHAVFTHRRLDTNQYGTMKCKYYWRDSMDRFQHALASHLMHDMERCFHLSAWVYGHDEERHQREREQRQQSREAMLRGREQQERKIKELRPLYDALMQSYNALASGEQRDKVEYPFERQRLNENYDAIASKFGSLHKCEKLIQNFPEYQRALSLERREGKSWVKADIFDHPVHFRQLSDDTVFSPSEALAMSLNEYGRVNMPYMRKLTSMSEDSVYEALRGEIFFYPQSAEGFCEWQHKAQCINGNIIVKHAFVAQYLNLSLPDFDRRALSDTLQALHDAIPTPIDYDNIDMPMGVRWLPVCYYERFMQWLFKCRYAEIKYYQAGDFFSTSLPSMHWDSEGSISGPYAVREKSYSGFNIFDFALADDLPKLTIPKPIYDASGNVISYDKDHRIKDEKGLQLVQEKVTLIRDKFDEFMHSSAITEDERAEIARIYNETMNATIRAEYDGSMQTLPGLDTKALGFELYQSQKDVIFMIKTLGGGICWHEVGGGKTMIMIVSAMEMKRLGLCRKPMIICLKSTVGQIADTFRKAYPNARILAPGQKDFTAKNRKQFIEQIANNDWDCVILTYDQFYKIPQNQEVMDDLFLAEIRDLEECLLLAREEGGMTRDARKGLQQRKLSLQNKMEKFRDKYIEKQDDVLDFKECGIDMLFVDEYHNFKNLGFNTRYNSVAGVGKTDVTIKTQVLLGAIRTIQKQTGRDLGAAFFSGTVVANALTELYVAFKYLRPKELKRLGMGTFDAWAANFCQKTTDYDLNTMAQIQSKERFRSYLNIPELSMMLREITDFRTAEMINLDRPKANIIEDFADPTPEQSELLERLLKYASSGNWSVLELEEKEYQDNSKRGSTALIATNLARDISLDARLMGENQFHDHPQNKICRCARRISEYYHKFNAHKGVQFVFCDVSKDKGSKGWNMYAELRDKLVESYDIPAREIAFIHNYDSDKAKAKLFEALNNGSVRIVVGTTQKLGTGVNAQQRAVAVHHLDIPWRPADLEQRNGRAVRAGNEVKLWGNNTVDVIVYGTNRTLDAYKFKLLQNKAFFLKQINNGSVNARHFDEDSMTEEGGIPYAEMVAALSGNQDFLVKAKLDAQVARLKTSKANHLKGVRSAESKIKKNRTEIENISRVIPIQQADLAAVNKFIKQNGSPCLTVFGSKDGSVEEVARTLRKFRAECHTEGIQVGTVYGMPIQMTSTVNELTQLIEFNTFEVVGLRGIRYRCDKNRYGRIGQSDEDNFHAFDALPDAISIRIADNETGIRTREADCKVCQVTIDTPWKYEQELADKQQELATVSARVQAALDAEEAKRQAEIAAMSADKD